MGGGDSKKFYDEFSKSYSLPPYEDVDRELEVSTLDGDKFILRTIRNKIKNRVDHYAGIIEDVLNPDTSISLLHECTYIGERKKKNMLDLYKKFMYMLRTADLLDVQKSMKEDARYIDMYFRSLPRIRREMKEITSLRMSTWKKEISPYVKEEYFG